MRGAPRRRGFAGFSYSLKAVGAGALYLSLWASFALYSLVPAAVAFCGMVLVTVAMAALAVWQSAEVLAGLALAGGFLTPVLVSTGENQEVALLSYLLLSTPRRCCSNTTEAGRESSSAALSEPS